MASGNPGETAEVTYRRTIAEVRLTVATDGNNRNLENLNRKDFAVVDDELIIRDFRSFSRSDAMNLDVVVLVDSSESILQNFRREISDVVQLISQTTWISDDHISVLSFGGMQTRIICASNCRSSGTADRLLAEPAGGATPLFDAIVFAVKMVSQHRDPGIRPVLILFSDGEDTISRSTGNEALEAALANDTQIYAVDLNYPDRVSNGAAVLQEMAETTGGRYFPIREGTPGILGAVLDDLCAAYMVTYKLPSRAMGLHSVRILPTHNLNLRFRCRRGYYYESGIR